MREKERKGEEEIGKRCKKGNKKGIKRKNKEKRRKRISRKRE